MENNKRPAFWDELEQQCPAVMEHFKKWIDEYKKEVGWDRLFAVGQYFHEHDGRGGHRINTKFHDLPKEMQQGIMIRYQTEAAAEISLFESYNGEFFSFIGNINTAIFPQDADFEEQKCRVCGCTNNDCSRCIQKTGKPCHWVEADLCSACVNTEDEKAPTLLIPPGLDI